MTNSTNTYQTVFKINLTVLAAGNVFDCPLNENSPHTKSLLTYLNGFFGCFKSLKNREAIVNITTVSRSGHDVVIEQRKYVCLILLYNYINIQ